MTPSQYHIIMAFKLNYADNYEPLGIENMVKVKGGAIRLRNYPIVFKAKCEELVEEGPAKDMEEATKMAWDWKAELGLYCEKGTGLYGIDNGNPTDNGPAKVYIVMENCRDKHSDETTEVLSVHTSREKAEEVVKTNKFNILSEWKNLMDGDEDCWETENDTASNYTLARVCDYEYYYSVWVVEKFLEC